MSAFVLKQHSLVVADLVSFEQPTFIRIGKSPSQDIAAPGPNRLHEIDEDVSDHAYALRM